MAIKIHRLLAVTCIPLLVLTTGPGLVDARKPEAVARQQDGTVAEPVDPNAEPAPTETPMPDGEATTGFPEFPAFPEFPVFPGSEFPDEVGVELDAARMATLLGECYSISVAGLSVAAHRCANGIDVIGTLPPGAPFTVFTASRGTMTVAAPFARSGRTEDIELPILAENLKSWVESETGKSLGKRHHHRRS